MELTNRVALITGAGGGLGHAIAEAFTHAGATVLIHDLRPEARAIAEQLGGVFIQADLANRAAVRDLAAQALEPFGRVDILVNNAGFQHIDSVEDFPEEIWDQMLQVMLTAPFQLIKYLLPSMRQHGWGRVINIASIHGMVASPFKAAYVSAKHGLLGLTKTVGLEAGAAGVTVNAICPAYVRTPLVERQIADQARTHGISKADVVEQVMLAPAVIKRLIEPEEVANLAVFLASDQAGAITGASFPIDLGWTAH